MNATQYIKLYLEAFIWLIALLLLAFMSPDNTQATFCVWHRLGFSHCLGCGLGHSISAAFHGQFIESFHLHPLGIACIIVLIYRIISICIINKKIITFKKKQS